MKMVKSLLLGSAAGLVAVTAGQAAELPVKAKPVEYVKVCSLYGAGFYYMPGTDMCIKIGGWVRAEMTTGMNGNITWGAFNGNVNQRTTSNLVDRARGYITADAREQTAYGTARGYIAVGISTSSVGLDTAANQFSANRAFVQWAGWTAGIGQSFYDLYCAPCTTYRAGIIPFSDTGDAGWFVWGYTAQFGGGFSATLSAEGRRTTQILEQQGAEPSAITAGSIVPGAYLTTSTGATVNNGAYGGWQYPDVVANLRLDQAWGSGQVMGALHELNPSYYATTNAIGSAPSELLGGHPSDTWGFAVGAGVKINFPSIAPGDYFQGQVNYTQGALRYLFDVPNTNWGMATGASEAYGILSDCVYGGLVGNVANPATGCQLTTAWGFNAAYEHYWTPQWRSSFVGWYSAVSYNAASNAMLCEMEGNGNGFTGFGSVAVAGCSNNWDTWGFGSRLQWDVTKSFYVGVEALYENLDSAKTGCAAIAACGVAIASPAIGGAVFQESNATAWVFTVRAHKDFLP